MIIVRDLTKRFTTGQTEVLAVDHLSFQVAEGEIFGLLGANGAGKTTTLRMVLGLLRPDEGFAEVQGFRTSQHPDEVKCRTGLVSTSTGLYQWLTPREMLLFFADLYGAPPRAARAALEELTELLGLAAFLDRRCATLSTGQAQRVNLARALIHDPPVMLLDEPTRGLDIVGSKMVFDYVDHLRQRGKAVIVSSHRLDEAQRVCDRFGLLHQGRIVEHGTLEELQIQTGCPSLVDIMIKYACPSPASQPTSKSAGSSAAEVL